MKHSFKYWISTVFFVVAAFFSSYAQPSADLVLTGNPNLATYPGYPVAGTFDVVFTNNTSVDIAAGSFRLLFSLPPGFVFDATYPGIPANWTYNKIDDIDASITPTAMVSGTPPASIFAFHVPFATSAAITNGSYLAQVNRLLPTYKDPDETNNTPSGTVSVANVVLPVDFVSINATIKDCEAKVDWTTANQVNLKQFELEYSTDGATYTTGKIVPINSVGAYSATLPVSGDKAYFFRVKALDLDGKYKYSSIALAKANCDGKQGAFTMYPNPVLKGQLVNLSSTTNESTMFRILDMAGKLVQEGRFTGTTTLHVTNGGTYIIDLQSASASTKYKLVVQ
jgi:hypothetical protein